MSNRLSTFPLLGAILNHLTGEELAIMKTLNRRYGNYINAHPHLAARVDLARRKSISRNRAMNILAYYRVHNPRLNQNAFINRIMRLPGHRHPLNGDQLRAAYINFIG